MDLTVVLNSVDFEKYLGKYCKELEENTKEMGLLTKKEDFFENTVYEIKKEADNLFKFFRKYQIEFNEKNKKKMTFTDNSLACASVYMAFNNHTDIRLPLNTFKDLGATNIKKINDYFDKMGAVNLIRGCKTN